MREPEDTAMIVGMTPSDQFVPPVLNLDGPEDRVRYLIALADAWDEGRDAGHEDTYLNIVEGRDEFDAVETPNPYREKR